MLVNEKTAKAIEELQVLAERVSELLKKDEVLEGEGLISVWAAQLADTIASQASELKTEMLEPWGYAEDCEES